jgi:hypothetical protein
MVASRLLSRFVGSDRRIGGCRRFAGRVAQTSPSNVRAGVVLYGGAANREGCPRA